MIFIFSFLLSQFLIITDKTYQTGWGASTVDAPESTTAFCGAKSTANISRLFFFNDEETLSGDDALLSSTSRIRTANCCLEIGL